MSVLNKLVDGSTTVLGRLTDDILANLPEGHKLSFEKLLEESASQEDFQRWYEDLKADTSLNASSRNVIESKLFEETVKNLDDILKLSNKFEAIFTSTDANWNQRLPEATIQRFARDIVENELPAGQVSMRAEDRTQIAQTIQNLFTLRYDAVDDIIDQAKQDGNTLTPEQANEVFVNHYLPEARKPQVNNAAADTIIQSINSAARAADDIEFGDTLVQQNNGYSATKVLTMRNAFDRATEQGIFKGLILGRGWDQLIPVKSLITDSTEVVKPVISVADGILEKSGLSKSLFSLDEQLTKNAQNLSADDATRIIDSFADANAGALKAAQEEIHKLRQHVEENFVTNAQRRGKYKNGKWVDGPDYARGSLKHDLQTEDKKALLEYLDSMENMIEDVAAGSKGKNGQEILESVEKLKSGELKADELLASPMGLSRSGFEATQAHIRLHGSIPGNSDIKVTHQWRDQLARQIDEGIYDPNYYQLASGNKGISNTLLNGDNVERGVYNQFFDEFTKRNEDGSLVNNFHTGVQHIKPFVSQIRTIVNSGFGPEVLYQINRMKALTQAPGEADKVPLPTANDFMDHLKTAFGPKLEGASETEKLYFKKIEEILSKEAVSGGGAKKEHLVFNKLRSEVIDNNRQNMHQAAVYAKNYELAFRFKNHDDLSTPGSIMINQWLKFKAKQYGAYILGADSFKPGQVDMNGIQVNDYTNPTIDWLGQRNGFFGLRQTVDADGNPLRGSAWAIPARSVQRLLTGSIGTRTGLMAATGFGAVGATSYVLAHTDDENLGQNTALAFVDSATIPFQTAGKFLFAPLEYGGRAAAAGIHAGVSDEMTFLESGAWDTPWLYQVSDWAWDTANPWMEPNYKPRGSDVITAGDVTELTDSLISNVSDLALAKDASQIIHNEILEKAMFALDFYEDAIETLDENAESINDTLDELIKENQELGIRGVDKVNYYTAIKERFEDDVQAHRAYIQRSVETTADALRQSKEAHETINAMQSYDAAEITRLLNEQRSAAIASLTLNHVKAEERILELCDRYFAGIRDGADIVIAPLPTAQAQTGQPSSTPSVAGGTTPAGTTTTTPAGTTTTPAGTTTTTPAGTTTTTPAGTTTTTPAGTTTTTPAGGTALTAAQQQQQQAALQAREEAEEAAADALEDAKDTLDDRIDAVKDALRNRVALFETITELEKDYEDARTHIATNDEYSPEAREEALQVLNNMRRHIDDAQDRYEAQNDAHTALVSAVQAATRISQNSDDIAKVNSTSDDMLNHIKNAKALLDDAKKNSETLEKSLKKNADFRYIHGGDALIDKALIDISGGKEGLLYQWFGKGGADITSTAGSIWDIVSEKAKDVWEGWQDVKRSAKSQSEANWYNIAEVGLAGIGGWWALNNIPVVKNMPGWAKLGLMAVGLLAMFKRTGSEARSMMAPDGQEARDLAAQRWKDSQDAANDADGADKEGKPEDAAKNENALPFTPVSKANITVTVAGRTGAPPRNIDIESFKVKTSQGHNGGLPDQHNTAQEELLIKAQEMQDALQEVLSATPTGEDDPLNHLQKQIREMLSDDLFDMGEQQTVNNFITQGEAKMSYAPTELNSMITSNLAANDAFYKQQAGGV